MDVVIIGGVAAGMSCAAKLKRNLINNVNITVYEKGRDISYGSCGIPFFISGKIEKSENLIEKKPEDFSKDGIDVKTYHEVISVDTVKKTIVVHDIKNNNNFTKKYDKLVVATGASNIDIFPNKYNNVYKVRDLQDAESLKNAVIKQDVKNIVIIGAGFIGLEIADSCIKYNKNITIIEKNDRILSPMDKEFSDILMEEFLKNKVNIKTGIENINIDKTNNNCISSIVIKNSFSATTIPCDIVINCSGIRPNTSFLNGIDKFDNGAIIVDDKMQTNIEDIYAAGDCSVMKSYVTNKLMYAPLGTNANKQGRIIADVISNKTPKPFRLLGSTAIRTFDIDTAKVGVSEEDAKRYKLNFKVNMIKGNNYASYYGEGKILIKVIYDSETRRLLGVQAIGKGTVVPRANYYAIAIYSGLTVDEMGFMDLCYSPPFGGVWDAALIASNTAK